MAGLTRRDFLVGSGITVASVIGLTSCRTERPDGPAFDVRRFGALADGLHDDTGAVQATIDAAERAGGGVVRFPSGVYRLQPQTARRSDPDDDINEGHALSVTRSRITFRGDGAATTRLVFRAFGGSTHERSWQVVGGKVFRGAGFFITGGTSRSSAQTDIAFEDLDIDGTAHCTHDNLFPADLRSGDGWDLTHKGIWMANDRAFDRIRISRCRVHGWKGEVVFYGGIDLGSYLIEDCELFDTNGDCHSVTARALTVRRNTAHTAASAGFEDMVAEGDGRATYVSNKMHDCDKEALSLGSAGKSGPWGSVTISSNVVQDCPRTGFLVATSDTSVVDNQFTDCAAVSGNQAIYCRTVPGHALDNVRLEGNRIEAVTRDVQTGIVVDDAAGMGLHLITVKDNWAGVTPVGVRNGVTFTRAYDLGLADGSAATVEGNLAVRTTY